MNLLNLKIERQFINNIQMKHFAFFLMTLFSLSIQAWEVDFSRRINLEESKEVIKELRWPASQKTNEELFSGISQEGLSKSYDSATIITVMQTEEGFVPNTIRLKKDGTYKIYIINVNEKFKNASFILDAFNKSFGTFFAKPKNFEITTTANGIFTFLSPESGAQGKLIVYSDKDLSPPTLTLNSKEIKK